MQPRSRLAAAAILICALISSAQPQSGKTRLLGEIDEAKLVMLPDRPAPVGLNSPGDLGVLSDDYPLAHLKLVLRRSPEAEAALAQRIDAMHDPQSAEYHHWLTAQQIGDRYGVSSEDTTVVRDWLVSHGFAVHGTYKGGFAIDFSGTAGLVRSTFHTELHNLVLPNGEKHVSNMTDPEIPETLAPVVQGIASLHDFRPRPRSRIAGPVRFDKATGKWQAHFEVGADGQTVQAVGPYDFATIYNLLPLWDKGYTGKDITIA